MRWLPWTLAYARLRKHVVHLASISMIVALAMFMLLMLQGISHSTSNSLVTYSLSRLPVGDRTLTISSNRILTSSTDYKSADNYLNKNLSNLTSSRLSREVLYHQLSDSHGVGFYFGGVEGLKNHVTLESGKFPSSCNPNRCEVLKIGGGSVPQTDSFGLVIVGSGVFLDNQIFNGTFSPATGVPVLVADSVASASSLPTFANFQGADGWIGAVNLPLVERVGPNGYIDSILAFANQLSIDNSGLTLTWPEDALGNATSKADALRIKLVLLTYIVGALLIAFLILFSFRQKEEHSVFRNGLSRVGTPKSTLAKELIIENGAPLAVGAVSAAIMSPLIPYILSVMHFHSNLSQIYRGWQMDLLLLLIALVFTSGFAILGDKSWGRSTRIPFIIGILLIYAYFAVSEERDTRAWAIPLLFAIVPALTSYFGLRWMSGLLRERRTHTYVLVREYAKMWQGVTAILTLTIALAVVTLSFDFGINLQVNTQAQDQVPLDLSVAMSPSLIRPLEVGSPRDYESLLAGSKAFPVLRFGSSIRNQSSVSDSLSLIGLPPSALLKMKSASLRNLSKTITPTASMNEPGVSVQSGSLMDVELTHIPKEVDLIGWFRTSRGNHVSFMFTGHGDHRTLLLHSRVPAGSTLVAFEFQETSDYLSRRLHAIGESSFSVPALKGIGSILKVTIDGKLQSFSRDLWKMQNFPYTFDGGSLFVRPSWESGVPTVVVDPITSKLATNGMLTLSGASNKYFQVHIGAIRSYFPSASDRFVIMNLEQLQGEIFQTDPGAIDPIEIWISTTNPNQYQKRILASPFRNLSIQSRIGSVARLQADPVNVGLSTSYKIALLFALLIALFMQLTVLPQVYRRSADLLFLLEVEGIGPKNLRRTLRLALRLTLLVGMFIGLGLGIPVSYFYISPSLSFPTIGTALIISVAASETIGFFYTRTFFTKSAMVVEET